MLSFLVWLSMNHSVAHLFNLQTAPSCEEIWKELIESSEWPKKGNTKKTAHGLWFGLYLVFGTQDLLFDLLFLISSNGKKCLNVETVCSLFDIFHHPICLWNCVARFSIILSSHIIAENGPNENKKENMDFVADDDLVIHCAQKIEWNFRSQFKITLDFSQFKLMTTARYRIHSVGYLLLGTLDSECNHFVYSPFRL